MYVYIYGMMLNILIIKAIKMGFLEKLGGLHSTDKKKVVSARVSENVLAALSNAEEDVSEFGYKFSILSIIDKALHDTLIELEDATGIDYYKLIKWRQKMEQTQRLAESITGFVPVDFDEGIRTIKDYHLATLGLDDVQDFSAHLKSEEDTLIRHWNANLKDYSVNFILHGDGNYRLDPVLKNTKRPESNRVSGHTVQTLSKLLRKSTDEVINTLNNAGVTGKDADSRISTDDRQKLISSLSGSAGDGISVKFK